MSASRAWIAAGPALLLVAAILPGLRPPLAVLLAAGWITLRAARRPEAIAWAAVLPVALTLVWPWLLGADVPLGETGCVDPLSDIAMRRAIAAAVVLAVVAMLARAHGSDANELGLGRPGGGQLIVGAGGLATLVVAGLCIGPLVARPFFGPLDFPVPPAALVPAVLFGVANGVLEEVAYRGAMQAWLVRMAPVSAVIGFQGLLFGIVHAGPEVVALLPVHVALLTAVGVAGGWMRWRTGSLAIPIGIHVGADTALYVGLACRASG